LLITFVHDERVRTEIKVLMTTAEAAEFLGLSVPSVHRLASAGEIATYFQHPGPRGARIFHRDELARVAAERNLAP
jgi:excisionase family DNA binding protein